MKEKVQEAAKPPPRTGGRIAAWAARTGLAVAIAVGGLLVLSRSQQPEHPGDDHSDKREQANHAGRFQATEAQWAALSIEPVEERPFRSEVATDGKIAIDENRSTPVFSPYSGRVTKIAAEPGDIIEHGRLLFALEATDMVQAQNDFIAAVAGLETARSQLRLAEVNEKRQHDLYDAKAVPLKDWQQARADLVAAKNTVRTAETGLEAVRNRLRILQKTEAEIADFEKTGRIDPNTPIPSPITGTVVQRKVGPGQFITSGTSDPTGDPVFVIGDLSTVWLVAQVRETDALKIQVGQQVDFRVLSAPARTFSSRINYVASGFDPLTRRLLVRATVENQDKVLKPETFASVNIYTSTTEMALAVPREAIIYEGDTARVWIASDDKSLELRAIKTGLINGNLVEAASGLKAGEKVVTKGALFIDRAATGNES
jgi:cobalt-zinc-cadmium efflux system membrane fusion protein